jgi:acyl-CoA synthetase (AMP-forming)/AMP-acid ligase II
LFEKLSLGPGAIVALAHGGTPAFFADLHALWSLGVCVACLNPRLTRNELDNVTGFMDAAAILVDENATARQAINRAPVVCAAAEMPGLGGTARRAAPAIGLDDPALILFTSGTTGAPKGVVHSFRSLLARIDLNRRHMGDEALARSLCVLPTHFGHGLIGNCLTPLAAGGELFLYPEMDVAEISGLGAVLADNDITFMSSVPTFWKIALKLAKPLARNTLERVHVGSAPFSAELWRAIQAWTGTDNVVNMYGITETANWLAGASGRDLTPEDGLVGRMWGGAAAVIGEDGAISDQGEGELMVRTPALMSGYLHRDDLTREVLRDGWFRTGDVGRIDGDGVIRMTGRRKSEINKAGMKIHPEELDLLLEQHPNVREACAFGIPDEISGELVGMAVVVDDPSLVQASQLRSWCAERIKRDCLPDKWFFVGEIPKTDRGKINRDSIMRACLGLEGDG